MKVFIFIYLFISVLLCGIKFCRIKHSWCRISENSLSGSLDLFEIMQNKLSGFSRLTGCFWQPADSHVHYNKLGHTLTCNSGLVVFLSNVTE